MLKITTILLNIREIKITDLDVEYDPECQKDSLVLGEGRDNVVIHRFCRRESNTSSAAEKDVLKDLNQRSHSQYFTFTWNSDGENQYRGFRIEYEFVDVSDGCGFSKIGDLGLIYSPNFPKEYPPESECIWDIQGPAGHHLELHFTHFELESSENCTNDAVIVSEEHKAVGNDPLGDYRFMFINEEKKKPLCGIHLPDPIIGSSNRLRINFTSNDAKQAKGFQIEWKAVCGAVYRQSLFTVQSPHYPDHYTNTNSECDYLIDPDESDANTIITLKMNDFDLSPFKVETNRYPCETDYVEIREVMSKKVVITYCAGDVISDTAVAVKGAVGIRFVTNETMVFKDKKLYRGFRISYSVKQCGGDIHLGEVDDKEQWATEISSPAFPLTYPHDMNCTWNITTEADRHITVKFEQLELEASNECSMDFVKLWTKASDLGTYCGGKENMPQNMIRVTDNQLSVRFVSDRTMNMGGFRMVLKSTLGPSSGCGGKLRSTSEWKSLTPPVDSNGMYLNNLQCGWTIVGPNKTMIEFRLNKMDTETLHPLPGDKPDFTCVDSLAIYDGYRTFSPILVKDLCKETVAALPTYYHSSHKVAHVYFETDSSESGTGFELQYRSVKPDCGDWITASDENQVITFKGKSISESHTGQAMQRCQWVIQSRDNTPIRLHITDFNIPSADGDCSDEFMEIKDVGLVTQCEHPACAKRTNDRKTVRYCGKATLSPFISNTLVVQITTSSIISDTNPAAFNISYQLLENCNRTIDASYIKSGQLTSPNYPRPYDHNTTCSTVLQAASNTVLLVVFKAFRMERGRSVFFRRNTTGASRLALNFYKTYRKTNCDHDYLIINENGANVTEKLCGNFLPATFLSKTNKIELFMSSDGSISMDGYDISYYSARFVYGAIVFHPIFDMSGVITNIGYPNGYNTSSAVQKWTVNPPAGHVCTFTFETLSIALKIEGQDCLGEEFVSIEHPTSDDDEKTDYFSERLRSCSHTAPFAFKIEDGTDRKVLIEFHTDDKTENDGMGFRMVWNCEMFQEHVVQPT